MKITINRPEIVYVEYLQIEVKIAKWHYCIISDNSSIVPCMVDNCWKPIIDVETGIITNWVQGVTVKMNCWIEEGEYYLLSADKKPVFGYYGFVPAILSGAKVDDSVDYIGMDIEANGHIKNWVFPDKF